LKTNHLGANWGLGVTYGMFGQSAKVEEQFKKLFASRQILQRPIIIWH